MFGAGEGAFPQHQTILGHQLCVPQFNPIWTLSTWRQVKGLVLQESPRPAHLRGQSQVQGVTCASDPPAVNGPPLPGWINLLKHLTELKDFAYQTTGLL